MADAFEKRIKRQVIGKPHHFLAVAPLGFEETLAKELTFVGVECASDALENEACSESVPDSTPSAGIKVVGDGKVEFTAKITEAWKAVAYSRIANRILMEIGNFKAENFGQLEKHSAEVPWELYLAESGKDLAESGKVKGERGAGSGLTLHVTCKHSRLYHSDAVKERISKVIQNYFIKLSIDEKSQANSSTEEKDCAQHLYVNLQDDRCTIWLDLSGEELYKRGHDRFVAEAPLKETIAAAMLFEASRLQTCNNSRQQVVPHQSLSTSNFQLPTIIDPMAGSGTFSLEAAYIANGLIPGKCRDFALKHQPAFKEGTWKFILAESGKVKGERCAGYNCADLAESGKVKGERDAGYNCADLAESGKVKGERDAGNEGFRAFRPRIITSDISQRPIDIIRHNVECSPLREIYANSPDSPVARIDPKLKDFFSYTLDDFLGGTKPDSSTAPLSIINYPFSIILLNPPYGKRLDCDAPRLYTRIGQKLAEWGREAKTRGIKLTVAILAPKDDSRHGARYTCTANLLQACPALDPNVNSAAKIIETSHGGFSLNAIFGALP